MSEFHDAQQQRKCGKPSWYDVIVPELDEQRRQSLDDALADRTIFHTTISRVMEGWGHPVSASQVAHYRQTQLGH